MDSAAHDLRDPGTLDPLRTSEVALLDRSGVIVAVNAAWEEFCLANGGSLRTTGVGVSYLDVCAAAGDDPAAREVDAAIRAALRGELPGPVTVEVPCHAPDQSRWFDVLVSSRFDDGGLCLGATVVLMPRPQDSDSGADLLTAVEVDAELVRAAAAFGRFALASPGVSATIERAVEVVAAALGAPMAAVMQLIGPGRVALLHSIGPVNRDSWAGADATKPSLSVGVPVSGRPWGRLVVSHLRPRRFRGQDLDFLVAVAQTLGSALHRERTDAARAAVAALGRYAVECTDTAELIERAVDVATHMLDAPMGALARCSSEPGRLELVQVRGPLGLLPGDSCRVDPALARAQSSPEPLVVEDWRTEGRFPAPPAATGARAASSLGVRVLVEGRPWGRLAIVDHTPRRFTATEAALLQEVADILSAVLGRERTLSRLYVTSRALQQTLLPAELPVAQGIEAAARYLPADGAAVGGDWYDILPLPREGHLGLVVGDVEGHGSEAAALMGQVRAVVRAFAQDGHTPAEVMARTNRYLMRHADRFVTCFYGELDPTTRVLRHVAAGHPAPLLLSADGWTLPLPSTPNLALGIRASAEFTERAAVLPWGGTLLLVTDGLAGSFEAPGDPDAEALAATARRQGAASLEELADALTASISAAHRDDATLLVVRLTAGAPGADRLT